MTLTQAESEALAAAHEMRHWSAHYDNLEQSCNDSADRLRDEIKRLEIAGTMPSIVEALRSELKDTELQASIHAERSERFWNTAMELEEL